MASLKKSGLQTERVFFRGWRIPKKRVALPGFALQNFVHPTSISGIFLIGEGSFEIGDTI